MMNKRTTLAYGAEEALEPHLTDLPDEAEAAEAELIAPPAGQPVALSPRPAPASRAPADQSLSAAAPSPAEIPPALDRPFPTLDEAPRRVATARAALPTTQRLLFLAERFKALADPTRLTLLAAMSRCELRVSELAEAVSMSQSAVSHQLRVLRAAKLVAVRREGKNAWYRLADDAVAAVLTQEK